MPSQTQPGDVANLFTRFILTQLGTAARGLTDEKWQDTLTYFGHCCAYTGKPLPEHYDKDHAVPLNRKYGGLHVYGNVLPALKEANSQKAGLRYDEFLNSKAGRFASLNDLGTEARKARIDMIEAFMQKAQPQGLLGNHPELLAFYHAQYEAVKQLCAASTEAALALLQQLQVPLAPEASDMDEASLVLPDDEQLELEERATSSLPSAYASLFEQYRNEKIGSFAQAVFSQLFADGRIIPYLKLLQDAVYSRQQLSLYFPALVHQRPDGNKYYATPYKTVDGHEYYLCNDWYRRRRGAFEDWLTDTVFSSPTDK